MSDRSELKIKKLPVSAIVKLSSGHAYKGEFSLLGESAEHHGHERLKDLLNSPEAVVPFFNPEKQEAMLLNKAHIQLVELQTPDYASDTDAETDFSTHKQLVMLLTGGIKIRGEIYVNMPPGKDRTLDFLNRGQKFLYLYARDCLRIINLDHLIAVEDFEK